VSVNNYPETITIIALGSTLPPSRGEKRLQVDDGTEAGEAHVHFSRKQNGTEGRSWVRTLAQVLFVGLCTEAVFSIPYRSVYLARYSVPLAASVAICAVAAIGICFAFRRVILQGLDRLLMALPMEHKGWLTFWLILGLAIRLAWILRFPVTLKSDYLVYFQNAAVMALGQNPHGAFFPPGFSLFLAPFFMVFGAHLWVCAGCALLLFTATYFLAYALALRIQGGLASRIAPMLVAVWPGYFMLAGINCKENFLAVLVPASVLLYLKASDSESAHKPAGKTGFRWRFAIAAGLCMGLVALTQPGYLLFPAVIFGLETLRRTGILMSAARTAVFTIAVVAAISPWTYRNYLVFHRIVPISTNGGNVFYRANNPLANAHFEAQGELPLPKDEFAADKEGYRMADEWITQNPGAFATLMVRKQIVYLGDDGLGAYETLKRDLSPSVALYASLKAISNLYWLVIWALLLLGFPLLFRIRNWRLWYGALFLPLLYQWVIDSVFESGPRHHVPYVALFSVLVGLVFESLQSTARNQVPGIIEAREAIK